MTNTVPIHFEHWFLIKKIVSGKTENAIRSNGVIFLNIFLLFSPLRIIYWVCKSTFQQITSGFSRIYAFFNEMALYVVSEIG